MTDSEKFIAELNSNFFFKEFTFSSNKFKKDKKGEELELADNVIWMDDIFMIVQIKERNVTQNSNIEKWFNNKVLRKAVKQVKDTIKYFKTYKDISIKNEKGHILNVAEAGKLEPIKLIIYAPETVFPDNLRFQKYYKSKDIGLINLFHIEDYLWICRFLVTPFEISEYLNFREQLFSNHEIILNNLPEQYVLGHYIETLDVSSIRPRCIENVKDFVHDEDDFDISFIIENFKSKILYESESLEYYKIIKELAKLNRADLREFKKRVLLSFENASAQERTMPYRITSLKSKCGFVFFPLEFEHRHIWENAIVNTTDAHKYDQKLEKCVGMIVYYHPQKEYYDLNWYFVEGKWEYNQEIENLLKESFPFRPVKIEKTYRYFLKDNDNNKKQ